MAVATYGTDLQTVNLAEATTDWSEMTGRTSGGAPTQEDRAYLQGSYAISQSTGVATARTAGLQYDYLSNIGWTSGFVFLVWQYWQAPKAIGTWADGGMRLAVGSSAGNVKLWNTQGNDYGRSPYGGWANVAVDPTYAYDEIIGTPVDGNYRIFCSAPYLLLAVSKGNPHCVDAIRYGRGQLKVEYGEAANYGTFAGMATANDADAARWGLFSYQLGSYLWKGLISLGTIDNAVDFRDTNRNIVIDDTPRTYVAFNKIEIRQGTSKVYWTNIAFTALGTLSKGQFAMIDNADVQLNSCQFTDMNTFTFLSNAQVISCIWLRCNTITAPGILLTNSKVLTPTVAADTSAIVWDVNVNLDGKIDGMTFSKGTNAHHAIELGLNSPTTMTLRGITFTGFNAANAQNDSVLHIKRTTGTVTISCVGCTGTVTYKSAGATVSISQGVELSVHVQDAISMASISGAAVMIKAAAGGPKPYQASVSITRVGSTATVTHTAHGLATNDYVIIEGCTQGEYNGGWQITYGTADTYTYTLIGTPTTPATGTPVSTFAPIYGTTDGSGNISDTRTYSSNQPITGRARKGTSAPYYKTMPVSGTINSGSGLAMTVNMISDD